MDILELWRESYADPLVPYSAFDNLCTLRASSDDVRSLSLEALQSFVVGLLESKRRQLVEIAPAVPMRLYLWFDAQIPALRFNIIDADGRPLPFRCKFFETTDPTPILSAFLASQFHDGVPWEGLEEQTEERESETLRADVPLRVFVKNLSGSGSSAPSVGS
jgi:hypothetical protein